MAKFPMIIVNETLPLVLKMNPNPNSISIDRSKVYSKQQTLGGWVFEHWGEQPRMLKVKGRTNPVLGPGAPGKNKDMGVETALFSLQQVYNLDKRPLTGLLSMLKNLASKAGILNGSADANTIKQLSSTFIYYKFDLYTGFFTSFSFEQDAEDMPRHYEYQFEFLVTASAQSAVANSIFGSSLAPLVGLAQVGSSGNIGSGAALLAGGALVKGIGGLNI